MECVVRGIIPPFFKKLISRFKHIQLKCSVSFLALTFTFPPAFSLSSSNKRLVIPNIPSSLPLEVICSQRQSEYRLHFPRNKVLASGMSIGEIYGISRKCLKGRSMFLSCRGLQYRRDASMWNLYTEGNRSTREAELGSPRMWGLWPALDCLQLSDGDVNFYIAQATVIPEFLCHGSMSLPKRKSVDRVEAVVRISALARCHWANTIKGK